MNNYVYTIGNKIYINLTNRCSNRCEFCIRKGRDGMENQKLWITEDPTPEDVIDQLPEDMDNYDSEVVFCGFGEPTYNLETLEEVASYLHCIDKTTRINTNGHANLIHKGDVSDVVADSCDVVNVSLNAPNKERYQQICNSIYGEDGYDAMLEFAKLCKQRGAKVVLSVVDVLSPKEVDECKKIASKMGVEFRLREKE